MNSNWPHAFARRLSARWIRFRTGSRIVCKGLNHRLEFGDAILRGVQIEIEGRGNQLVIGAETRMWAGKVKLHGENLRCEIGDHCQLRGVELTVEDKGSRIVIHDSTSGTRCRLLAGEGGLVQIGIDCMMSVNADIRNTDGHSVLDAATGVRLNPAADVVVGDHAWIGLGAQILKGVEVGAHSIVAAGCVVVKDVPPNSIVAGVPAHVIREGVTWKRQRHSQGTEDQPRLVSEGGRDHHPGRG